LQSGEVDDDVPAVKAVGNETKTALYSLLNSNFFPFHSTLFIFKLHHL
jgi:hypothetical protein